jgi:heme/copper-type cytochrome/quinol oxidase subunit 1
MSDDDPPRDLGPVEPSEPAEPSQPRRRAAPGRVLAAGLGLLAVGLVVSLVLATRPVHVGWFASAPLTQATFSPGVLLVHPGLAWSVPLAVVGAVLVSGAVGYALGRRAGGVS